MDSYISIQSIRQTEYFDEVDVFAQKAQLLQSCEKLDALPRVALSATLGCVAESRWDSSHMASRANVHNTLPFTVQPTSNTSSTRRAGAQRSKGPPTFNRTPDHCITLFRLYYRSTSLQCAGCCSKENRRQWGSGLEDHLDHIAKVAGVEHVGLGSDYEGISSVRVNLEDVSTFPNITQELLNRAYCEEDIQKILGGNILRAMQEAEEVARSF